MLKKSGVDLKTPHLGVRRREKKHTTHLHSESRRVISHLKLGRILCLPSSNRWWFGMEFACCFEFSFEMILGLLHGPSLYKRLNRMWNATFCTDYILRQKDAGLLLTNVKSWQICYLSDFSYNIFTLRIFWFGELWILHNFKKMFF